MNNLLKLTIFSLLTLLTVTSANAKKLNFNTRLSNDVQHSDSFYIKTKRVKRKYIGFIKAGVVNPVVSLESFSGDLDIQVYDLKAKKFIIGYGNRPNNKKDFTTNIDNHGDKISWSGYNGRFSQISNDTKSGVVKRKEIGREFVRFHGKTKRLYLIYVDAYYKGYAKVKYSWGANPIYAGIFGMGQSYVANNNGNKKRFYAKAIDGVIPKWNNIYTGNRHYEGYGITLSQAVKVANGINMTYLDSRVFNSNTNHRGQSGIALLLSNYSRGSGDIANYSSANVNWTFNKIKQQKKINKYNNIFISGHSSGGGDAQDLLFKFKNINQKVKASFQIDSVEFDQIAGVPVNNDGDKKIPINVEHAFNYYQNETWYNSYTQKKIEAVNPNKTSIVNQRIKNPKCRTYSNGTCKEDGHQAIDNDPRVWNTILSTISYYAGIKEHFS